MRAHGGDPRAYNRPRQIARIEWTDRSSFLSFSVQEQQQRQQERNKAAATASTAAAAAAAAVTDTIKEAGGINETRDDDIRTNKVAKKTFSDHGDHHYHNDESTIYPSTDVLVGETMSKSPIVGLSIPKHTKPGNLVRKMTVNANELFRVWQDGRPKESKIGSSKRSSTNDRRSTSTTSTASSSGVDTRDVSPHRQAFSKMEIGSASEDGQQPHQPQQDLKQQESPSSNRPGRTFSQPVPHHNSKSNTHSRNRHGGSHEISFGSSTNGGQGDIHFLPPDGSGGNHQLLNESLSAVLESASQNSSQQNMGGGGDSVRSKESRGSSSIATRSSMGTRNSVRSFGVIPPRGKCLTQPSEGVSNDNLDNVDGNLVVYENDVINVSRKQIHVLCQDRMHDPQYSGADFRIQSLLGQGTFAQVFQCLHVQTGNLVAVKVVKNNPAYTRQAAVEIDVFRALTRPSSKEGTSSASSSADHSGGGGNKWDYMVDMICYFMYKDHLCLVFERLGANLYEVLKKRQFRGLPLGVVRTLMRQALLGTKELAHRSIVHCDLKPENILLVTEDDVDSIVSAGEHKRVSSSQRSGTASNEKKHIPVSSTATVNTNGQDSGNSSSTYDTDNTNKSRQPTVESVKKLNEKMSSIDGSSMARVLDWNSQQTQSTDGNSTQEPRCHSPANSDGTGHTNYTNGTHGYSLAEQRIKLIDFGSACFEGQTAHTYIQSRFYRSPEVLIGLTYDSAIDLWSLGCVAAELFLGLPILPGVHEHDQVGRICEMIADLPDWMLDQGSKSSKYFVKFVPAASSPAPIPPPGGPGSGSSSQPLRGVPQWRIKTQQEVIASMSQNEIQRKGGLAKLEKLPANRYFKRKLLSDIVLHKGHSGTQEDKDLMKSFIHFLYGTLLTTS
jgi:serine/threonine protein kinase